MNLELPQVPPRLERALPRPLPEHPVDFLKQELQRRQNINPAYSLRAFARHLKMTPGRLSEIFSGKRNLSSRQALLASDKLNLSPSEKKQFLDSITASKLLRSSNKIQNASTIKQTIAQAHNLSEDAFFVIAEWEHFAMYSLLQCETKSARTSASLARRLNISDKDAERCLERLQRLQMASNDDGKTWKAEKYSWHFGVDSAALRRSHAERLALASQAVERVAPEQREFSALTLTFHPEQMAAAKAMIQKFRRTFAAKMELAEAKEVYALNIQFFPLSHKTGVQK